MAPPGGDRGRAAGRDGGRAGPLPRRGGDLPGCPQRLPSRPRDLGRPPRPAPAQRCPPARGTWAGSRDQPRLSDALRLPPVLMPRADRDPRAPAPHLSRVSGLRSLSEGGPDHPVPKSAPLDGTFSRYF
ncbi:proline-rich protein 2-like [Alexandromys fortis]|uniref:proline-rich protein 2-like n=1 Tax=Alexandromys fortis TaxID=100897 RepID=UPI0021525EA4|nr:proline-rich protein 2-like [Microtus fortis]